jgi:tRNA-2-methylthio-N6-dimethylallyladenosine synthase
MNQTYFIETYGCPMNRAESSALTQALNDIGYHGVVSADLASWVIINTCSVRQTAEDRIWGRLGFYKAMKIARPELKVAVMGCMAVNMRKKLLGAPFYVDQVIGHNDRQGFIQLLQGMAIDEPKFSFFTHHASDDGVHAMVPVMHGCNHFCSFCIIPYLRGREIGRNPDEIIAELKHHVAQGIKEITLLGQTVNGYRFGEVDFPALIKRITAEVEGDVWFRFTSSHPKYFTISLIEALKADERFCPHLHLAVQHGTDSMLTAMKRQHNVEHFRQIIQQARKMWSQMALITDLMVGFPGETEENFTQLMRFVEEMRFDDAFMYQYNDREGTFSYGMDKKVDEKTKLSRLTHLIEVQRNISHAILRKQLGSSTRVLLISVAKQGDNSFLGRTLRNESVVVTGSHLTVGDFVDVILDDIKGQTLIGVIIH